MLLVVQVQPLTQCSQTGNTGHTSPWWPEFSDSDLDSKNSFSIMATTNKCDNLILGCMIAQLSSSVWNPPPKIHPDTQHQEKQSSFSTQITYCVRQTCNFLYVLQVAAFLHHSVHWQLNLKPEKQLHYVYMDVITVSLRTMLLVR